MSTITAHTVFDAYLARLSSAELEEVTAKALHANAAYHALNEIHPGPWGSIRTQDAAAACLAEVENRRASERS